MSPNAFTAVPVDVSFPRVSGDEPATADAGRQ